MDELERELLIDSVIWFGSLVAPLATGISAVSLGLRQGADRVRIGLVGAVVSFAFGAAGSFAAGDVIIGALMGSGDIPIFTVAQAWHRMWYPVGIGLLTGFGISIYSLIPKTSTPAA